MKELTIYEFQAKQIEDTLRMVVNVLKSQARETSLDRDVMQSWEMIKNILVGEKEKTVKRFP
jgi:predicted transcriptional regulator